MLGYRLYWHVHQVLSFQLAACRDGHIKLGFVQPVTCNAMGFELLQSSMIGGFSREGPRVNVSGELELEACAGRGF